MLAEAEMVSIRMVIVSGLFTFLLLLNRNVESLALSEL